MSLGLKIFLLILFLLVAAAAIFFLYLGIRKDHQRFMYERHKLKDLPKEEFDAHIKLFTLMPISFA